MIPSFTKFGRGNPIRGRIKWGVDMKKKKKWLSLCALIGMLSVVLSLSASADYYYTLDRGVLTDVQQAKSNWCWAACAEMAGHYVYPQTDKSQWAVVRYFKGTATEDYPNVGGDSSDMERAVEYVANNTVDYSVVTAALRCSQIYNEVVVDDKAIVASMQPSSGTGHAILVYGIRYACGVDYVRYIDPWDAMPRMVKYSELIDGTVPSLTDLKWDQSVYER
mgnify:CR=1 FL=1